MPKTKVQEHTRKLANGTQVTVHDHDRSYVPGADAEAKLSPVESHRRERLKAQARERREAAWEQGKVAWQRAKPGIKKRGQQTAKLAKKAGKRMSRAAKYASKRRRTMAACCVAGAAAEVSAGLLWSTGGLVWTAVSIGGAALTGGLLIGRKKEKNDD